MFGFVVFQHDGEHFAALGHDGADGGGETGNTLRAVLLAQFCQRYGGDAAHFFAVWRKRVAAQIKSDGGFFFGQLHGFAPSGCRLHLDVVNHIVQHIEQAALVCRLVFLLGVLQRQIHIGQQHGAVGFERVECAAANQGFHRTAVDVLAHAFAKIQQTRERAVCFALGHNLVHHRLARAFNRAQCVADFVVRIRDEAVEGLVDVGRQEADAVHGALRIVKKDFELVGIVQFAGHGSRHEFGRIMRFEPRGLVRHIRIGRRVRFVEAVSRKFFHVIEDFIGFGAVDILLGRPFGKNLAVFHHFFGFFLTHGTAQQVRTAQRITANHLCSLHDLLLIHHNAVGRFQHGFEQRVHIFEFRALHPCHKIGNVLHRAGAV